MTTPTEQLAERIRMRRRAEHIVRFVLGNLVRIIGDPNSDLVWQGIAMGSKIEYPSPADRATVLKILEEQIASLRDE